MENQSLLIAVANLLCEVADEVVDLMEPSGRNLVPEAVAATLREQDDIRGKIASIRLLLGQVAPLAQA